MGCSMSSKRFKKVDTNSAVAMFEGKLNLSFQQKQLIKDSWAFFEPKKTAIGRKMFVK